MLTGERLSELHGMIVGEGAAKHTDKVKTSEAAFLELEAEYRALLEQLRHQTERADVSGRALVAAEESLSTAQDALIDIAKSAKQRGLDGIEECARQALDTNSGEQG